MFIVIKQKSILLQKCTMMVSFLFDRYACYLPVKINVFLPWLGNHGDDTFCFTWLGDVTSSCVVVNAFPSKVADFETAVTLFYLESKCSEKRSENNYTSMSSRIATFYRSYWIAINEYFRSFSAIHEFNKALDLDREHQRAGNGLKRAQKLQKISEKRDYYKILNVKRTATKQEIIKAYR